MRITVPLTARAALRGGAAVVDALRAARHEVRVVRVLTGGEAWPAAADAPGPAGPADPGRPTDATWVLPGDRAEWPAALPPLAAAELADHPPDAVLVGGDDDVALAVALAARRAGRGVVHLEAGLRSRDESAVDELVRRQLAVLATVHLAPTRLAAAFLREEGVPEERVRVVGSPVLHRLTAGEVPVVPLARREGVALLVERAGGRDALAALARAARLLGQHVGPVTLPVPPAVRAQLQEAGHWEDLGMSPDVRLREPLGYDGVLALVARSRLLVTDTPALQEEAAWFGVPTVVLRRSTPRWEGVISGAVVLAALDDGDAVVAAARQLTASAAASRIAALACPYGDGVTPAAVVAALDDPSIVEVLLPRQADFRFAPPPLPRDVEP